MKKQYTLISGLALSALVVFLLVQQKGLQGSGSHQGGESHPGETNQTTGSVNTSDSSPSTNSNTQKGAPGNLNTNSTASTNTPGSEAAIPQKKEDNCFKFSYQHQSKNQNRDIEEFLNDTNAFPILHPEVNAKSICVKVNDKAVAHKWVKKSGKSEVMIGSVVGPESTIQVSYCLGSAPCKESCIVKTKNKVDELLSETEISGVENAALESQVKELRNVASVHGDLMDSTVIRDWAELQKKSWVCEK